VAIPDFVLALRAKIGNDPLWLSGVTAVVTRPGSSGSSDVLLVRRADTGAWTPVTGIIDPGEEPADAAARETLEEAGVVAVAERLVKVHTLPPMTYENGDQAQYLDLVFRMRWVSGEPWPADGENTEAAWLALSALPPMSADMLGRLEAALSDEVAARFSTTARVTGMSVSVTGVSVTGVSVTGVSVTGVSVTGA
jgi:8-oxo-dGTP pyrophosphatase MutT (NUDIX family)